MQMRQAYGYDTDEVSLSTGLIITEPSLTQQHFKDDADINVILDRFGQGHEIPKNYRSPQYGDFEGVDDYQTALNAVREAAEAFLELPALVRERFGNDPQQLIDFVGDDKNRDEAVKLGLLEPGDHPILDVMVPTDTGTGSVSEPEKGESK